MKHYRPYPMVLNTILLLKKISNESTFWRFACTSSSFCIKHIRTDDVFNQMEFQNDAWQALDLDAFS